MSGILYVVATPIGNLEDMTYRAVRILQEVSLIAAEDTRHSRKLLSHYSIGTSLISYHEHNEEFRSAQLIAKLQAGESIALISDAGTPCIAAPGYRLLSSCRLEGVQVVAVPGPSAVVAALSISGLPTDAFRFVGFLPAKTHGRCQFLEQIKNEQQTVACYEAPHRLLSCLADIIEICGADRPIAIARELTKRHEELFSGSVDAALKYFAQGAVKGELVLLLGPALQRQPEGTVKDALSQLREETDLSWKEIVKRVAKDYGLPGSEVYKESLELR
ncbi:MAG: 16S rRNA (cytidine(1402)-2'-O)-methyltransferase [Desulfuromusa sp.]|nr:16S rRNA (cytidine(1402)-2'-O)-methyltransferase [Desulfuromusa sp.]